MPPLRVAVIGGRRRRDGLGPFVARDLAAAGAEVTALVATSPESCAEAVQQMQRFAGLEPRTYLHVERLLAEERLDALAVCSPHAAHADALERALDAGLHVLCEKPLVWGDAAAERGARLAGAFAERGLVLFENCQWPYALPAFERLHPGSLGGPPRHFAMRLSPNSLAIRTSCATAWAIAFAGRARPSLTTPRLSAFVLCLPARQTRRFASCVTTWPAADCSRGVVAPG